MSHQLLPPCMHATMHDAHGYAVNFMSDSASETATVLLLAAAGTVIYAVADAYHHYYFEFPVSCSLASFPSSSSLELASNAEVRPTRCSCLRLLEQSCGPSRPLPPQHVSPEPAPFLHTILSFVSPALGRQVHGGRVNTQSSVRRRGFMARRQLPRRQAARTSPTVHIWCSTSTSSCDSNHSVCLAIQSTATARHETMDGCALHSIPGMSPPMDAARCTALELCI